MMTRRMMRTRRMRMTRRTRSGMRIRIIECIGCNLLEGINSLYTYNQFTAFLGYILTDSLQAAGYITVWIFYVVCRFSATKATRKIVNTTVKNTSSRGRKQKLTQGLGFGPPKSSSNK